MATSKGPIYKEKDTVVGEDLLMQLEAAVGELAQKMKATVPIQRGGHRVGWGVDKLHRNLSADRIIAVARAIKSLGGW